MSPEDVNPGLAGLRVLSLESRCADQMARLIENHQGVALVTPRIAGISRQAKLGKGEFQ